MDDSTPLILCLHGMGGHSNSRYLQLFTRAAVRRGYRAVVYNRRGHGGTSLLPVPMPGLSAEPRGANSGMGVVVDSALSRGVPSQGVPSQGVPSQGPPSDQEAAGDSPVASALDAEASPKIFPTHVNMDDMQEVVSHLRASHPRAPMYLIGFSCGANLCIHYLATSGEECPFIAAGSVSH